MRSKSLGLGVLSIVTSALLIGACSASGSGSGADGEGTGTGTNDASAAGDGSSSYGDASNTQTDSGAAKDSGKSTGIDSGGGGVIDSGPPPSTADCDLSGSGAFGYILAAQSSSETCGASDSCGSGECCVNFAALFAGGGSLPPAFAGLFTSGSASMCVPN
ncbi:MAG: hypothetical protein ABI551_19570 [Polyangiaceae bacterium]